MIVRLVVSSVEKTTKAPAIHLPIEGGVPPVPKVRGNDFLLKLFLLQNTPRPSMWKPCNSIRPTGIQQDLVKFDRERGFFWDKLRVQCGPSNGSNRNLLRFSFRWNLRKVPVRGARVITSLDAARNSLSGFLPLL